MAMNASECEVAKALHKSKSCMILCHVMPDGDAVGSSLGLAQALDKIGKRVCAVSPDPIPNTYGFLEAGFAFTPADMVTPETVKSYDTLVFLDCTHKERVGALKDLIGPSHVIINIDHHITNSFFGDLNFVDPRAAAVGEQVLLVIEQLGVTLDEGIANCLYAAILTDTGCFRYENTTPRALQASARLLLAGAKPAEISEAIYESKSYTNLKVLGAALSTLKTTAGGKIAWMTVSRDMLAEMCGNEADTEGIINYARAIRGVEVGLLFKEISEEATRVGLRSRAFVDVSAVAAEFGGGGHPRAAGCTVWLPLGKAQTTVIEKVTQAVIEGSREADVGPGEGR
jgi:phosphoesterase RecJ-like protein